MPLHFGEMASIGSVNAITQGTLVRIVAGMHEVPAERLPSLKGRMRNFLSMGFPDVAGAGMGRRAEYWPEHVADTIMAFELCKYRIPQTAAAQAVMRSRSEARMAIGEAARRPKARAGSGPVLLRVVSNAFLEDAKRPDQSDVSLSLEPLPAGASSWTIDCDRLVALAVAAARLTDEPLDAGFFARLTRDPPA